LKYWNLPLLTLEDGNPLCPELFAQGFEFEVYPGEETVLLPN
jgi:hypothetical protein